MCGDGPLCERASGCALDLKYIKDVVLGAEKVPDFFVGVAPTLAYAKEAWIRSGQFRGTESEAPGAKELVGIWNEVVQSWDRGGAQDAINSLAESVKFFGASFRNPLRTDTPEGVIGFEVHRGEIREILA